MKFKHIFTGIGNAIQYNKDNFIILVCRKKDRILFNTYHAWSTLKRKMRHIKKGIGLKLLFHVVSMRSYIILAYILWSVVLTSLLLAKPATIGGVFSFITRVDFRLLLGLGMWWIFLQASHCFLKDFILCLTMSKKRQYFSMYSVSDLILNSLEKTVLKAEK